MTQRQITCSQICVLGIPSGQVSFYKNSRMENECVSYLKI